MRLHVVSDVHGAADELARAAHGADLFVCLGDLILFMDYADPARGIFADIFGADHTRAYIDARTEGRFEDARELTAAAWQRVGIVDPAERREEIMRRVDAQYAELFRAMPDPAYLTYGNVDIPDLWAAHLRPGHTVVDGGVIEHDGLRLGFVGGGLLSPMRTPFEMSVGDYAAKLAALGPVDVLFSHIPPADCGLTYDVLARRFEVGSLALVEYVRRHQPRLHLFGHVHNALRPRLRIGRTECVNVGHFAGRGMPFVVDL